VKMGRPRKFVLPLNKEVSVTCVDCGYQTWLRYRLTITPTGEPKPYHCKMCRLAPGVATARAKRAYARRGKAQKNFQVRCNACRKKMRVSAAWLAARTEVDLQLCPACLIKPPTKLHYDPNEITLVKCPKCGTEKRKTRNRVKAVEWCASCKRHYFPEIPERVDK
jgi:Zn ribbon nucleic-acid-binding protein